VHHTLLSLSDKKKTFLDKTWITFGKCRLLLEHTFPRMTPCTSWYQHASIALRASLGICMLTTGLHDFLPQVDANFRRKGIISLHEEVLPSTSVVTTSRPSIHSVKQVHPNRNKRVFYAGHGCSILYIQYSCIDV